MDDLDKKIESKINENKNIPLKFTHAIQSALYKENKTKNKIAEFTRVFATACAGILIAGGVSLAGHEIYQRIWKDPERITLEQAKQESNKDEQIKNMTESEAKEFAEKKLEELKFENEKIVKTKETNTNPTTNEIYYTFITNNNFEITIHGKHKESFSIYFDKYDKSCESYTMARKEAIKVAKELYNKLGYKEGEYQLVSLRSNNKDGYSDRDGYQFFATFSKVYEGLTNNYETIVIDFLAKEKKLYHYSFINNKFENNPIEITKEQAIEIAKNEDRKVETKDIIETNAELRIEKMNSNAYARLKYTDDYYKPMMQTDVPDNERYLYKTDDRVRRVWIVVFNYAEKNDENKNEFENLAERTQKGQYSYFVDCTTGEIIGGDSSDYLRWDNHWTKYYSVE